MRHRQHSHPCSSAPRCQNLVECGGELNGNHDGYPEVICSSYHNANGSVDPLPCHECEDSTCVVCGAVTRLDEHEETCSQHPENRDYDHDPHNIAVPFARNH